MDRYITIEHQGDLGTWRILGVDEKGQRFELVNDLNFQMHPEGFDDAAAVELMGRRIAEFAGLRFDSRPLPEGT